MRPAARTSRLPALAALLFVVCVIAGAGLALPGPSASSGDGSSSGMSAGLAAVFTAGQQGGRYSRAEPAALSQPLPEDAVPVEVPVLMYHYVDAEPPPKGPYADGLTVRTPDFVEELDYLTAHGYETVSLADAYLAMAGLRDLPAKPVVLTFDDGGLDNYEVAFPLLKQHGFTATFFVITETVGSQGQMSWDHLREMFAAGMSIQSHSVSHPDLTGVSDERLRSEVSDSRGAIAEITGEPGYVFCYPAGSYDPRVVAAVRAAGYVMAVTTDKGAPLSPDSVFEITRTRVQPFLPMSSFARLVD
ncbi:MAG: polysaccharide deacetylase family protein [Actinomycetia bacterium]|nr:polysaccharide deacetylase family protein [Actinomycetes bacterium]